MDLPEDGDRRALLPLALVALAVAFNLVVLRAERLPVAYPNDSALHLSMVGWAQERIAAGHLPFDGWFPYLQAGAAQFQHYQSLPHILTGAVAELVGSERAFGWALYLLLALWPVCIYWSGRLLGWGRWPAGLAALLSLLLVSTPSYGYEYGSYLWRGWGMWSQLWGMWALPLALALSWRAIADKGRWSIALAALALAVTVAFHFLTGYLAFLSVAVLAFLVPRDLWRRLARAAAVVIGGLLVAAWVIVPVVLDSRWIVQDEFSVGTFYHDSYGARRVLGWLVRGELFDGGRLPVITVLVALGIGVCVTRWRRDERARVLLATFVLGLLLFSGRPTLGPALKLLPGADELFLHRYIIGVHLAGIFLAGVGAAWLGSLAGRLVGTRLSKVVRPELAAAGLALLLVLLLFPAWSERIAYARTGARWIDGQRISDGTDGADVAALVRTAESLAPGRIYAGLRSSWGRDYTIGQVPVYSYLLREEADGIGFTLRTSALTAPIEARFDETNPAQYDLFDVRYVILPSDREPPVPATLVERRGRHALWRVSTGGYLQLVDTVPPPVAADRTNIGRRMESFLRSDLLAEERYRMVAWDGAPAGPSTLPAAVKSAEPPGVVVGEFDDLGDGLVRAEVRLDRPGVALLKASFDPGWTVRLDGQEVPSQMVAPSYVGRAIPPGRHQIVFEYRPFRYYWLLFLVGALTLVGLAAGEDLVRRRARGTHDGA